MRVYIAGAITDNPNYKAQFEAAEERLRAAGHEVFNPAKNQGYSYKEYIDMGLFELMRCEVIYLLKGYKHSTGALLELDYARTVGLDVIMEAEEKEHASIGSVWLDLSVDKLCVVSEYIEGMGYIVTYSDGSGGFKSEKHFEEYYIGTGKTINIRSVLDELEVK